MDGWLISYLAGIFFTHTHARTHARTLSECFRTIAFTHTHMSCVYTCDLHTHRHAYIHTSIHHKVSE